MAEGVGSAGSGPAAGSDGSRPAAGSDGSDEFAGFAGASAEDSARANRTWWDGAAEEYLRDHGPDLDGRLVWGPEGLDEADAGLLGDVAGLDVLEVGAGAAQCAGWLAARGARVVATDLFKL